MACPERIVFFFPEAVEPRSARVRTVIHRCGTGCGGTVLGEAEPLVTDAGQLWKVCAENLHDQVTDATWKTWFEAITPVALEEDRLTLAVPSSLMKERLEGRYLGMIGQTVSAVLGGPVEIRIEIRTEAWADAGDMVFEARNTPGVGA